MNNFIATYGYLGVFLIVAAESLGLPLPGETALIAAGTYAGSTHRLSVWGILAVATLAAIVGDNIGFWIGDKLGYRLVRNYGKKIHLDESKLKVGRYVFDRYGTKVVFFGRFVSVLRTYAAFLAGTNKMPWRRFLPANALGGVVWAAIFSFAAYYAGNTLRRTSGTIDLVIAGAAAVVIVIALLAVRRQSGVLTAKAEAAYPGPLV